MLPPHAGLLPADAAAILGVHGKGVSPKPGLTGLWQIGARRNPEFDHWVEKDLEYIDSWSLWLDFKIIARTVPAMIRSEGR
jgi:lipopolysaccharide/colanic/teichoic acid biosynthesis glycosyltransferase